MWPKPLPNHWLLGQTIGVSVDSNDHIWIIHRAGALDPKEVYAAENPRASECCLPAPPVLEFDEEGNLIGHWGAYGKKPDDVNLGRYNPNDPPAQQFRNPVRLRGAIARWSFICLRPAQRPHPRVQTRRNFREGKSPM